MKLAGIIVAFLIALGLIFSSPLYERLERDNQHRARLQYLQQLEIERHAEIEAKQVEAVVYLPAIQAYLVTGLSAAAASGLLILGLIALYKRIEYKPLVWSDDNGNFPLPRQALENNSFADLIKEISINTSIMRQLAQIHQPGQTPHTFTHNPTHAPRITLHNEIIKPTDDPIEDVPEDSYPTIPPFSDLVNRGILGPNKPLGLGLSPDGSLVEGTWEDISANAIAGLMGSGKTTTAAFIAAQAIMQGGKIVICDPHGNAPEGARKDTLLYRLAPLRNHFMCEAAISPQAILASVKLVHTELRERIEGKRPANDPVLLVIDEFSSLMRRNDEISDEISKILEIAGTEGRKFLVSIDLLSHQWHVSRMGGGALRSILTSAYLHRLPRSTARMLAPIGTLETAFFAPGEGYLFNGDGLQRIFVPLTTSEDLDRIAGNTRALPVIDAASVEILQMFASGMNVSDIVRQKYDLTGGGAYNTKLIEVNDIIRNNYRRS